MRAPRRIAALLVCCGLAALAGCKEERHEEAPVRPVLSVLIDPVSARTYGFTGTVQPRYRVSLGFQVLGRLIVRKVEIGDQVRKGDLIAAIDPIALELALRSAAADVASAEGQLANAKGVEERTTILFQQNVSTQAQLDTASQALLTASASLRRAQANFAKAKEQLGYARLQTDTDGVVTDIGAQVGQVVAAGQTVATVARPDIREASVDIPDDIARDLKPGIPFDVSLQLDPSIRASGVVREIAPQADAQTRTRRVLVTLANPPDVFRLGTTITATVTRPAAPTIDLPRSALLERDGKDLVWVVDPAAATVSTREVTISRRDEGSIQVADGLTAGTRVVTAGVHSLTQGQKVKVPGGETK